MTSGIEILTFGHGIADAQQLAGLLRGAGVRRLVDVRMTPGSRRNPDANQDTMRAWLAEAGIAYHWDGRLGGRRPAPPDSPDVALRHPSFRGYAAHMRSPDFLAAADDLARLSTDDPTAVMCAESLWWRCHRKLIADFLVLVRGIGVRHLMHNGSLTDHRPSPEARLTDDRRGLVYDAGQTLIL
jgi:uncharacterized protein (DUF488 family)